MSVAQASHLLACPRDRSALEVRDDVLVCPHGHDYPNPDGIPVLVVEDIEPTQPGYWAYAEQIQAVRAARPPEVEGDGVDPYVAELIIGTHGNLYRDLAHGLPRREAPEHLGDLVGLQTSRPRHGTSPSSTVFWISPFSDRAKRWRRDALSPSVRF